MKVIGQAVLDANESDFGKRFWMEMRSDGAQALSWK